MQIVFCVECGNSIGSVAAPTKESLAQTAQADPMLAGLLGMLPDNVTEIVASLCTFRCPSHTVTEVGSGNEKEKDNGDALDEEYRERQKDEAHREAERQHYGSEVRRTDRS